MRFKIFYRRKPGGKLYWERYNAPNDRQAANNFRRLALELGETIIIVRVEPLQ
jgi:hypothetical protein